MKRRIIAALAAVALGVATLGLGAASPAVASPQTVAKHVALGDSIAAGQGGGAPLDACGRTSGGYAAQLDQAPKFNLLRNAACAGDTIADVQAQLSQLNRGTTVVTLTVGANDLHLDVVYAACAAAATGGPPIDCFKYVDAARAAAPALTAPLAGLIGDIAQRSPNATIVVTGYPHLLEPMPPLEQCAQAAPFDLCVGLTAIVDEVNAATDALNGAIEDAADAAGADYVDVVTAFATHGVNLLTLPGGTGQEWFGLDPADPGFLHPTSAGYAAYAQEILGALGR